MFDTFTNIQVRVGFENITEFAVPLIVNTNCSEIFKFNPATAQNEVTFTCGTPLEGRFLSIQKLQFGMLQVDEIKIEPTPGIYLHILIY